MSTKSLTQQSNYAYTYPLQVITWSKMSATVATKAATPLRGRATNNNTITSRIDVKRQSSLNTLRRTMDMIVYVPKSNEFPGRKM